MLSRFARSLLSTAVAALLVALPGAASAAPDKAAAGVKDAAKSKEAAAKDAAKKAELARKAEAAKKVEAAKKAELAKKADEAKKAELAKKADEAKKAEAAKKAELAKKADAKKADEEAKKAEAKKADDLAKKAEAKKAELAKKADVKKAELAKKADVKKAEVAKKDDFKAATKDIKGPASVGAPNRGFLVRGVKLRSSRSLKVREHAQSWGVPALVKLLQRVAGKIAKHHPKSVMLIGDLSQKSGGALTGHNSHQSGRDADVGFYVANSKGQAATLKHFVAFDGSGKSTQVTWAQFDDARNWSLVEALLTDKETPVRYIFVSLPLRARVLAFAAKKKVAKELYTRAESALMAPRDADVHDDHFHVRIACPETMKGYCQEESSGRGPVAKVTRAADPVAAAAAPAAADDAPKPAP